MQQLKTLQFYLSFQVNKSREKYFGWILEEKYDIKSLENYHSLNGKDQFIGNYLDQANKILPEEEQYEFYVVKYERVIWEPGTDRRGIFVGKIRKHHSTLQKIPKIYIPF